MDVFDMMNTRMEPDVAPISQEYSLASIAVSLVRIASALEGMKLQGDNLMFASGQITGYMQQINNSLTLLQQYAQASSTSLQTLAHTGGIQYVVRDGSNTLK